VTRTFPANGRFTEEQAEAYDTVLAAQLAAIRAVRPGVTLKDVHRKAVAVIRAAGYEHGIRHATSHHIGLDVHDPRAPGRIRPGMVFSVEPGLYLEEEKIGIRIEDTVLVTEHGCRVLSDGAPKTRPALEALMAD
jgi:Xaa-Pro aminopeptidase